MNLIHRLLGALAMAAPLCHVQAATVSCPGSLGAGLTRQVSITGALAGGECYYQPGNFAGDNVSAFLGSGYSLIDKDINPDGNVSDPDGSTGGALRYAVGSGATSGTWAMASNLWATYDEIFIGLHFGNGRGDPDAFLVELDPGTRLGGTSGDWALLPVELANGLSNIYLFGRGVPTVDTRVVGGAGGGSHVPEPGTIALAGLALLGVARARRCSRP